jgi:ribonuclease HI
MTVPVLVLGRTGGFVYSGDMSIQIYTDGGCHGNPGPGGWAYILLNNQEEQRKRGGEPETTNNRMELTGVIEALKAVIDAGEKHEVIVHTDSQYVQKGISQWINNWIKNGWRTASKQPVKNKDLWMKLHELDQQLDVHWKWVKGHAGNHFNEECDQLVQQAIAEL